MNHVSLVSARSAMDWLRVCVTSLSWGNMHQIDQRKSMLSARTECDALCCKVIAYIILPYKCNPALHGNCTFSGGRSSGWCRWGFRFGLQPLWMIRLTLLVTFLQQIEAPGKAKRAGKPQTPKTGELPVKQKATKAEKRGKLAGKLKKKR